MESVVISQRKLACEVFFAFSVNRSICGVPIQPCIMPEEFTWCTAETPSCKHTVSRDHIAFRATIEDMAVYLDEEFREFHNRYSNSPSPVSKSDLNGKPHEFHKTTWHSGYEVPDILKLGDSSTGQKEKSHDVLIDVYGNKSHFAIGWYDADHKEWFNQEGHQLNANCLKWKHLPL
jgi:hypothetical protein